MKYILFISLLRFVSANIEDTFCTLPGSWCRIKDTDPCVPSTCHNQDDVVCKNCTATSEADNEPITNITLPATDFAVDYWTKHCQQKCPEYPINKGTWCEDGMCKNCDLENALDTQTCGKYCTDDKGKCDLVAEDDPNFEGDDCSPCSSTNLQTPLPALDQDTQPPHGPYQWPPPEEASQKPPLLSESRKPYRSGRKYSITLWHEGVVGDVGKNTSESARYVKDMVDFVDYRQIDRVYLQAQDPTVEKYAKKLFAYAQPEFVSEYYLGEIDKLNDKIGTGQQKIAAGLLIVVNPSYPWGYEIDLPGGMRYNNPGYQELPDATELCTTPIRHCHGNHQCFQNATCGAIKNWCHASAIITGTVSAKWAKGTAVTYTKETTVRFTEHGLQSKTYQEGTTITYWPSFSNITYSVGAEFSWDVGTPPFYPLENVQVTGCCQAFAKGCPNNYEQAFKYVGEINRKAEVAGLDTFITTIALDGEDISQYGTDPQGMAQAWQAARKYAPRVNEIGVAKQGSLTTEALGSNAAFPELYWVNELQYSGGGACGYCKAYDDMWTDHRCLDCLPKIYQEYRNKPQCMLNAWAPYMGDDTPKTCAADADADIVKTLTKQAVLGHDSPFPTGTTPMFSIEHAHSDPSLVARGDQTMAGWISDQIDTAVNGLSNDCIQKEYDPTGICGTFDGFGNWEWEKFEEFMDLFSEVYDAKEIAVYEWQFVPKQWRRDTDGDGIPDGSDPDIDGDGIPNHKDADAHGYGQTAPDKTDTDGDGIDNNHDPDIDGDGIHNDSDDDKDGDGILNLKDADADGDGTTDAGKSDIDGDGVVDGHDDDQDGDGIPNHKDADADGDGQTDTGKTDTDGDGIVNGHDDDIDGDGTKNPEDPDTDGDGIHDGADSDADGDGTTDAGKTDTDGDGIHDGADSDADGDGTTDAGKTDTDGDGIVNGQDDDIDGDGTHNDSDDDKDGDGILNLKDADADGDGTTDPDKTDTDGDGIHDNPDVHIRLRSNWPSSHLTIPFFILLAAFLGVFTVRMVAACKKGSRAPSSGKMAMEVNDELEFGPPGKLNF